MDCFLATAGSEAGSGLARIGMQLALLGGIALFLGALRLWWADRTRPRLFLVVGLGLFAVGLAAQNLERLGLFETSYYPGWKADRGHDAYEKDGDVVYTEEDMAYAFAEPRWWEGTMWWGQRFARLLGMSIAILGFVLDGRVALAGRRGRPKKKKRARS